MAEFQMDTRTARAAILSRVRSVTRMVPQEQSADEAWQAIPRSYRQSGVLDIADRIALLEERLHDYGAGVYQTTQSEVTKTVAAILMERSKKRMVAPIGIDPDWLPMGFTFVSDDALSYNDLDACDGVLTGCTVAIATTGTLVLCHGAASAPQSAAGRRALTLVPDYHICVVQLSSVVETVSEAMHFLETWKKQPMTLISGPSATADIEMTRIQGVHGPRLLDVVLVR